MAVKRGRGGDLMEIALDMEKLVTKAILVFTDTLWALVSYFVKWVYWNFYLLALFQELNEMKKHRNT